MSYICNACGKKGNEMPTLVHREQTYCYICAKKYDRSLFDWIVGLVTYLLTFYFSFGIPTSINIATYIFFILGIYGFTLISLRLRRTAMLKDDIILKNIKETEENEETDETEENEETEEPTDEEEPKDNSNEIKEHNMVLKKIQRKFDKEISHRNSIINSEAKKIKLLSEVSSDNEFIFNGTDKIHDLKLFWNLYFSSSSSYIYLVPTDQANYVLFFNLTPTSCGLRLFYHILSEGEK